jgi:hypothetical protein
MLGERARLAPGPKGRYIEREIAAVIGGFLFRPAPRRRSGKLVEVPNLASFLG